MATPDVTFFINGNAAKAFDFGVTLDMVDVGATPTEEMRFSNNGVVWSPWEIFATSKTWDLRTDAYGGSLSYGIRYVFAEFKNADGVLDKNDRTEVLEVAPRIDFTRSDDPSQRAGEYLVDVPYKGVDIHLDQPLVDLIDIEYDLTGLFIGSEEKVSLKEIDPAHTGVTGLMFSNAGEDHNLVWDVLEDVPAELVSATVKVRFKAHHGIYTSVFYQSEFFRVNTRSDYVDVDTPVGPTVIPGSSIRIEFVSTDALGNPVAADSLPSIVSIVDPDAVEVLGGPIAMTAGTLTGHYFHDYATGASNAQGQWVATIEVTINGELQTVTFPYFINNEPMLSAPPSPNACMVYGTLYDLGGSTLGDTPFQVFADDLSDPGHFNPTVISTLHHEYRTDANGFFSIPLLKNAEVVFHIDRLNYTRRGKVPDAPTADFRTLALVQPTPPRDQFGNRT